MKIIGLTGGIGSGKSTVLKMFKELGVAVYIADVEAKKLMTTNSKLKKQIISLLGEQAYVKSELNRTYIASIVFKDEKKLKALNKLVHPKVNNHFKLFVEKSVKDIIIYENAILFESGGDTLCDYIITVTSDFEDRVNRIMKRDDISKQQVLDRVNNQLDDDYKVERSDFVIKNSTLKDTKLQVSTIYNLIISQC